MLDEKEKKLVGINKDKITSKVLISLSWEVINNSSCCDGSVVSLFPNEGKVSKEQLWRVLLGFALTFVKKKGL